MLNLFNYYLSCSFWNLKNKVSKFLTCEYLFVVILSLFAIFVWLPSLFTEAFGVQAIITMAPIFFQLREVSEWQALLFSNGLLPRFELWPEGRLYCYWLPQVWPTNNNLLFIYAYGSEAKVSLTIIVACIRKIIFSQL